MRNDTSPSRLRKIVASMRSAHRRRSQEWVRRMETPKHRGPGQPL